MEVLASMFVICIGLLGVLAVIPYGAYQTAKAKNAENTAWLLDAAVKDLQAMELAKPENWIVQHNSTWLTREDSTSTTHNIFLNHADNDDDKILNCSRFLMIDPFSDTLNRLPLNNHIFQIGTNFTNPQSVPLLFRERMTGQDDLVYTTHPDKRTDFSGQSNKILSSGQYTWFFMFRPQISGSVTNTTSVYWTSVNDPLNGKVDSDTDIDILGCYNRVPGSDKEKFIPFVFEASYYNNSISVNIPPDDYDWKETKYVFLSWKLGTAPNIYTEGGWYKVINVSGLTVFLQLHQGGTLYTAGTGTDLLMLIIPGVMYHKQISATIK
jgi:hypothetical protein